MGFFKDLFSAPKPDVPTQPTPATDAVPSSDVLEELRAFVAGLSEGRMSAAAVDPTARLFDSGYVDSLSSTALLEHLEKHYGVYVTELQLVGQLSTLAALAEAVRAQREPPP